MSHNKTKWAYWISTALLSLMYLGSAVFYLTHFAKVGALFGTLGYPTYLVPLLIVIKPLGVLAILSRFNIALSNLAYAGIFYHLLLALSAHLNAGDFSFGPALVGLTALAISYFTQNAARARKAPPIPRQNAA
ncbi:DoxX family protein [Mesorhizobium sp. M1348]|uniref:DoxX family protein n=1 Tax=unclassified Mesorhizobium TaxID=325217 RepID=UPI003334F9A5